MLSPLLQVLRCLQGRNNTWHVNLYWTPQHTIYMVGEQVLCTTNRVDVHLYCQCLLKLLLVNAALLMQARRDVLFKLHRQAVCVSPWPCTGSDLCQGPPPVITAILGIVCFCGALGQAFE